MRIPVFILSQMPAADYTTMLNEVTRHDSRLLAPELTVDKLYTVSVQFRKRNTVKAAVRQTPRHSAEAP